MAIGMIFPLLFHLIICIFIAMPDASIWYANILTWNHSLYQKCIVISNVQYASSSTCSVQGYISSESDIYSIYYKLVHQRKLYHFIVQEPNQYV